jgi:hypothetical protein
VRSAFPRKRRSHDEGQSARLDGRRRMIAGVEDART